MTAPLGSRTNPEICPESNCACSNELQNRAATTLNGIALDMKHLQPSKFLAGVYHTRHRFGDRKQLPSRNICNERTWSTSGTRRGGREGSRNSAPRSGWMQSESG